MKRNLVEALIGAAVLIVAGWFFTFTYKTTEFGTVKGYELSARFERVDGLAVGNDVRLGGIKVGTVTAQDIDLETYQAIIKMSIDSAIHLPADSSVKVSTEGLLGNTYLSLEPGGDETYLQPGDEIEFTQGTIDVVDLIGRAIFSKADKDDE